MSERSETGVDNLEAVVTVALPDVAYQMLSSNAELAAACARWQHCSMLALDTEFMRVSTFYPQIGLLQLATDEGVYLLDPLSITDWVPFKALLVNPAIVKVLHSCSEDLLVFWVFLRVLPQPIFDTQIAGALLGAGMSVSYQNLIKQQFGVELPKGETRSDWLQRPLTRDQLEYAALDVLYLQQCYRVQLQALTSSGRLPWLQEECERLLHSYDDEMSGDFADYYQNFKSAWQLRPRQLLALQKLAAWREQRARLRNKPRSWVIKDAAVFAMVQQMVQSKTQLAGIDEVSDNFVRHEGDAVLSLIAAAAAANEADCPPPLPHPLTNGQKAYYKKLQEVVEAKAQTIGLPPEFLGRKRFLQPLLYAVLAARKHNPSTAPVVPNELNGWRKDLLLADLLAVLHA